MLNNSTNYNMKNLYILFFAIILFSNTSGLMSQTVWTGPTTTFTKISYADWQLEENQDRITDNVWITRANNRGLFNVVLEPNGGGDACLSASPLDTEWAYGTTADYSSLTYIPLGSLITCDFENVVNGNDIVLHLITDDIYIDFKFTYWAVGFGLGGPGGGGVEYERSTQQVFCGNNPKEHKVEMCHKGQTICVDLNAVQAHLNHGDTMGACEILESVFIKKSRIYPNPIHDQFAVRFDVNKDTPANLVIYNFYGKLVFQKK